MRYQLAYAYPSSDIGGKRGGWYWEDKTEGSTPKPATTLYGTAKQALDAILRREAAPVTSLNATIPVAYLLTGNFWEEPKQVSQEEVTYFP